MRPASRLAEIKSLTRSTIIAVAMVVPMAVGIARADMTGHGGVVRAISMSADGARTLTASFDYSIRLWRFDEQRALLRLDGHEGPVNDVAFLANGRRAVSAGSDGRVIFWSLSDGRAEARREAHGGRAMSVAVSLSGDAVLSGGWDGDVIIWDAEDASERFRVDGKVPLVSVGFARDGTALIAADRNGALQVLRRADGTEIARREAHSIGLTQMVVSRDGTRAVTIGLDNLARVWRLPDLELVSEFLPDPAIKPLAVAMSDDAEKLLVGYVNGRVLLLNARTGRPVRQFKAGTAPAWATAFTPDGRFALIADASERVSVWHLNTGDRIDADGPNDPRRPTPWLESDHPGARLFRKCANCHALTREEVQRSGPHFAGLFGRRAGSLGDYAYSKALLGSDIVWEKETLRALFEEGPDHFIPGTKMPAQRIPSAAALNDLVDYMAQIAPPR